MSVIAERRKWRLTTFALIFASVLLMTHSARMIYQGIYRPDSFYPAPTPDTLDFWFDWFFMFAFGLMVGLLGWKRWFDKKKGERILWECPVCHHGFYASIQLQMQCPRQMQCPACGTKGDLSFWPKEKT